MFVLVALAQSVSQSVSVLENPTHWGSETAVYLIFVKPVLDVFAVRSLITRINLSHGMELFMLKKSKYFTRKG